VRHLGSFRYTVVMKSVRGVFAAGWLSLILVAIAIVGQFAFAVPQAPGGGDVPVVKGGAGPCSADFVVRDAAGKGIYDAKIEIQIRYGFGGFHRLDAKVGTNVDGQARIEGLPDRIKNSAQFTIIHGDQSKTVPFEPENDCQSRHEVTLGEK
jgi:hypothetical protein